MPLTSGEVEAVNEAINFVASRYGIKIGGYYYNDVRQTLWVDVLQRGIVQRFNSKKSELKTWVIFCLLQAYHRYVEKNAEESENFSYFFEEISQKHQSHII
jgi:hypothetical protein